MLLLPRGFKNYIFPSFQTQPIFSDFGGENRAGEHFFLTAIILRAQSDNSVHFLQFPKFHLISFTKKTYKNFSKIVLKFIFWCIITEGS
jgi:hypothetical protein